MGRYSSFDRPISGRVVAPTGSLCSLEGGVAIPWGRRTVLIAGGNDASREYTFATVKYRQTPTTRLDRTITAPDGAVGIPSRAAPEDQETGNIGRGMKAVADESGKIRRDSARGARCEVRFRHGNRLQLPGANRSTIHTTGRSERKSVRVGSTIKPTSRHVAGHHNTSGAGRIWWRKTYSLPSTRHWPLAPFVGGPDG